MAAKEKINLLEVIPFRSAHITTKKESDGTIVIAFPRFKYEWMQRFLLPKDVVEAHDEGILHFHDIDYFCQKSLSNCELVNLEDMLQK